MPLPDDSARNGGGRDRPLRRAISRTISRAIVVVAVLASAAIFVAVDSQSHSASDTFYGMVVPEAIVVALAATGLLLVRARGDSAP